MRPSGLGQLLLALLVSLAGCDCSGRQPGSAAASGEDSEDESTRPRGVGVVGAVVGSVRLAEGASLPAYPLTAIQGLEDRPQGPSECPPPQRGHRQPVRLDDGGLVGVLVSAAPPRLNEDPEAAQAFGESLPEWEPREHEVAIRDCRLTPAFVTATRGDTLVLTNETDYPYLPVRGQSNMMQALLKGEKREIALDQGGLSTLHCGFAAPCGRTDLVVLYHPVHTQTDAGGRFELDNVPADQDLELHAWHPLFQDASASIRVERNGRREVELVLTPIPTQQEPAPTMTIEGRPEDQPGLF